MKIVADERIPYVNEYFSQYGDLILKPGRQIKAKDVSDADVLLVRTTTHVNKDLLQESKVKFVGSVTAGCDHLDTQWLEAVGIKWAVATGFNAPPVADYVVSLIAHLQKKQKKNLLADCAKRAAVIGVGNVGKLVVERLKALSFDVTVCDPIRAIKESDFTSTPLEEIENFDLIALHVPLTKLGEFPTYHLINEAFLKRQKPGCILINASRGAVINEQALLQHGDHLHWCLDVWEHEPNINKALLERTLIATPHIAGYSVQSKKRGIEQIYQHAVEYGMIPEKIPEKAKSPMTMPFQTLQFSPGTYCWQDIVLGIFNPDILSMIMKTKLIHDEKHGHLFDEMRHQFNYRHEFAYTTIEHANVSANDLEVLRSINVNF